MPKLSYMQRREHHSTLRPQSQIYGPRLTRPILHWGFGLGRAKGAMSVCVCFRGVTGRRLCFDYIFLKLGDLRVGGGGGPDLRFADDGDKKNLINS